MKWVVNHFQGSPQAAYRNRGHIDLSKLLIYPFRRKSWMTRKAASSSKQNQNKTGLPGFNLTAWPQRADGEQLLRIRVSFGILVASGPLPKKLPQHLSVLEGHPRKEWSSLGLTNWAWQGILSCQLADGETHEKRQKEQKGTFKCSERKMVINPEEGIYKQSVWQLRAPIPGSGLGWVN